MALYSYDVMANRGLKLKLLTTKILNDDDKKIISDNSPIKIFHSVKELNLDLLVIDFNNLYYCDSLYQNHKIETPLDIINLVVKWGTNNENLWIHR